MIGKATLRWLISLVAIAAILIILLLTPLGLRFGLHFASAILPGSISYKHASGKIIGPIEIRQLKYTDGQNTLSIHKLKFSWKPWKLLQRKIDVSHFAAHNMHLTLSLAKSKSKKTDIPTGALKPYLLNIHHAHIDYLFIGSVPNKYPVKIRHIRLNARLAPDHVNIQSQVELLKPFPLKIYFNANGNLNRYTLYARARSKEFYWHLYGLGNSSGVFLNLQEGKTLGGTLSFNANLKWAPKIQWNVDLDGTNLNFNQLNPDWPSQIALDLTTEGSLESKKTNFTLKTLITAPGTYIKLKAKQKNKLDLSWDLKIENLSKLYKNFKGALQTKGKWMPEATTPLTEGSLQAKNFSVLGYSGAALAGNWLLYSNQNQRSKFKISGTKLKTPGLQLNSIRLEANGSRQAHQLNGHLNLMNEQFAFKMRGGLKNKTWNGLLEMLTVRSKQYRNWRLTKPTELTLSKTQATLKMLCLKSFGKQGTFCLKGDWNANTDWQFNAKGKGFSPGLLTNFVSPKLQLNSPSNLVATISGHGKTLQSIKANVTMYKGSLHYQLNGNYIASPLQRGQVHLLYAKNKINLNTKLFFSKSNDIALDLSIEKSKMNGTLSANFNDLTPFSKLFTAISNPKGNLSVNLVIGGHLNAPDVRGNIRLRHGRVFIPRLGIELTKINTDISSFNKNSLNYQITAYSKNQPIHLKGQSLATPQGVKNTITIDGNNVLIMDTSQYTIYATPKLKVIIHGYNINLTGSVNIPKGLIQPKEFHNVISLPNNEIVYTAGEPITDKTLWKISAKLDISLGKDVQVKTSGFDTTITGKATLTGKPKTTTLANGRIDIVKGNYSAYGKTLVISPGSYIQFINSPVDNPSFNIRATKLIQITQGRSSQSLGLNDIIVGVALSGSFRHPKISLFSIPATLSQADILSYLLLGYASESSSGSNLGILLEAANTLGGEGSGIGGAISQIKQGLGLAELGVESETLVNAIGSPIDQQTAFVIGKRLTKNIYIRYSLGLGQGPFAPVNIFQLRYTLNPHWAIQTDSSTLGNGGDILYTIQTD